MVGDGFELLRINRKELLKPLDLLKKIPWHIGHGSCREMNSVTCIRIADTDPFGTAAAVDLVRPSCSILGNSLDSNDVQVARARVLRTIDKPGLLL